METKKEVEHIRHSRFCDLRCEYASIPDKLSDGAKSCMTFSALHCKLLKRLVYKSAPCQALDLIAKLEQEA